MEDAVSASASALFIAVFLACVVEAVEAVTIVLAAGTARDWRSAGTGTASALAVLAIVVAILGPAVAAIPITALRVVVGALLLVFGLQWLRKAVLRASGHKSLHDEDKLFAEHMAEAKSQTARRFFLAPDWYGFTLAFKGVLLEGLEVVFIVLTFGANAKNVGLASIAAGCATVLVAAVGFAVRAPLARVPENTMKFVVGIMLTSFGVFWGGEGAGASWPGSDAALLVIIPAVALFGLALTWLLRRSHRGLAPRLRAFGAFWYDFVIGDDWVVAAGVVVGLLGTWGLHSAGIPAWWVLPLLLVVLLPVSLARAVSGQGVLSGFPLPLRRPARRTPPASPRSPQGS